MLASSMRVAFWLYVVAKVVCIDYEAKWELLWQMRSVLLCPDLLTLEMSEIENGRLSKHQNKRNKEKSWTACKGVDTRSSVCNAFLFEVCCEFLQFRTNTARISSKLRSPFTMLLNSVAILFTNREIAYFKSDPSPREVTNSLRYFH